MEYQGKRVLIEFEGIRQTCYLYVNGTMAGYTEAGVGPRAGRRGDKWPGPYGERPRRRALREAPLRGDTGCAVGGFFSCFALYSWKNML